MYKNNFRIFYKSFSLLVIFILIGFLAFSIFFNFSKSVQILNQINKDLDELDSGFENIELQVTDKENNLYQIDAISAKKITSNVILFHNLKVRQIIGEDNLAAKADYGTFDEILNHLILNKNIDVDYFDYNLKTAQLVFEIKNSIVTSSDRLDVSSRNIKMNASGLKFDVKNKKLISANDVSYHKVDVNEFLTAEKIEIDKDNQNLFHGFNVEYKIKDVVLSGQDFIFLISDINEIAEFQGSSNIKMINPNYQISSKKIYYNALDSKIYFKNNVEMKSSDGIIHGDALIYNLDSEIAEIVSKDKVKTKLNDLE
jgi:LPS export ABC transporter protein LptC